MEQPEATAPFQTSEELLPLVYAELRKLAASRMEQEHTSQTLQPTALVHEAWLRLGADQRWNSQGHFFGAAALAMRRILVDRARARGCQRRGGDCQRVPLESLDLAWTAPDDELLAVNDALTRLEAQDPVAARLLDMSESTAKRLWIYARAFLRRDLGRGAE